MSDRVAGTPVCSAIGPLIEMFVREKQALGYRYERERLALKSLDRFLCVQGLKTVELPRPLVERWISKRSHESSSTHNGRASLLRGLVKFMISRGCRAHLPSSMPSFRDSSNFVPRILTREEVGKLLNAADRLRPDAVAPLRHIVVPEIFRLLYGCGMRLGEVLHLTVGDVDLLGGMLTVREGKFRKDRLVPMAPSITRRLRTYSKRMGDRSSIAIFFPAPHGGPYSRNGLYETFRELLRHIGIPHGGRGQGPRVHDIRHTFACHRLAKWYREGADLNAKLPILAAYLGHRSMRGTQRYLHMTADFFPELALKCDAKFGYIIPQRVSQ